MKYPKGWCTLSRLCFYVSTRTRMSYFLILLCNKSSEAYLCSKSQPLSRIVVAPFQSIDKQILTLQFKFKVILGTQNISFFSLPCEIKSMANCRKPMLLVCILSFQKKPWWLTAKLLYPINPIFWLSKHKFENSLFT